jgi:hypothetical protein
MNKITYIIILLAITGCSKLEAPEINVRGDKGEWYDAMAVTRVDYISHLNSSLNFSMEIAAMRNCELIDLYPDETFNPAQSGTPIVIDSIKRITSNENDGFQTLILVDETVADLIVHDKGQLIDAINRLYKITSDDSRKQFGIGYFARDESFGFSPVHFYKGDDGSVFTQDQNSFMDYLVSHQQEMGRPSSSSLYDAMNEALDQLIENPSGEMQSLTVVAGKTDDGNGSANYNSVLNKAIANNIAINIIEQDFPDFLLSQMALRTGGFTAVCDDNIVPEESKWWYTRRPHTVIYHINELLSGNGKRYKIYLTATLGSGNWNSGSQLLHYIYGNYNANDLLIWQYLPVYLRVP